MEIKILCTCGSKYKFDVEPVNGRVPAALSCPNCKTSWTEYANAFIAQSLGISKPAAGPPPIPVAAAAHAPVTAQAAAAAPASLVPQPPAAERPRLRVSVTGHAPAATAPAPVAAQPSAAPPSSLVPQPPAAEKPRLRVSSAAHTPVAVAERPPTLPSHEETSEVAEAEARPPRAPSFALGLLGAFLGAAVGATIFFVIFNYTLVRFKLLALCVGFLAGLGARLMGRQGSTELGLLTGVFTLVGIFSAQYFVAKNLWGSDTGKDTESGYETSVAEARKVMKAIPTGSDQEIRLYLAKEDAEPDEKPDPRSISDEEVKDFRETALPEFRDLASGKTTKEEFEKKQQLAAAQDKSDDTSDADSGDMAFKYFLIAVFVNRFNLVCVVAAVGLAYKMSTDA